MLSDISSIQTVTETPQRPILNEKEGPGEAGIELDQFPEGGVASWCTVVGGVLVMFCGLGYTTSFGVYQEFYTLHYLTNSSPSAISWIGSVSVFFVTGCGIVAGALHDRGYFYHLMIGGSLLQSFTLFMLSLAQPGQYYQIFLAQGIGLGIAQGIVYVPTMAVVSQYFHKRRTLAMSLVACGVSLGSIVHPIMLNYLIYRSVGFATGVRISAAFISALLLFACLLMRTRLKPAQRSPNYLSVGKGILHDVPFCIMCVGSLCFQTAFVFPLFYFQLASVMHGNSETFSFYSLAILNGGSLMGRLSAGFIAPRVGVPAFMIMSTAGGGIIILAMIALSGVASVVVLGTLYGYFAGVYIALLAPIMALLTHNLSELGARMRKAVRDLYNGWVKSNGTLNNMKVFVSGKMIRPSESHSSLEEFLSPSAEVHEALATTMLPLLRTPALSIISNLQRSLDALDIEGITKLHAMACPNAESLGAIRRDPSLQEWRDFSAYYSVYCALDHSKLSPENVDRYLMAYLLSATFKDCSVILRMRRSDALRGASIDPNGIFVIDLDLKSASRFEMWAQRDRRIVEYYRDTAQRKLCVE